MVKIKPSVSEEPWPSLSGMIWVQSSGFGTKTAFCENLCSTRLSSVILGRSFYLPDSVSPSVIGQLKGFNEVCTYERLTQNLSQDRPPVKPVSFLHRPCLCRAPSSQDPSAAWRLPNSFKPPEKEKGRNTAPLPSSGERSPLQAHNKLQFHPLLVDESEVSANLQIHT